MIINYLETGPLILLVKNHNSIPTVSMTYNYEPVTEFGIEAIRLMLLSLETSIGTNP